MRQRNLLKQKELKSLQKNEIKVTEDEIQKLNLNFNLINDIVIKIEAPSIEKELKLKKEEEDAYIFESGLKEQFDEDSFLYVLKLPKKNTFKGHFDENDKSIFHLLDGKYEWPSGQKYKGKFNKDNQFDSDGKEVELIFRDECKYKDTFEKGKLKHGIFTWNNKGYKEYSLESYFSNGKINGNFDESNI